MGLAVAGVDMLRSDRGPVVMEVNSSPGLEGIERASGVDVAGEIIEYIEGHVTTDEPAGSAPKKKAKGASAVKGKSARGSKNGSGEAEGTAAAEPAKGADHRKGRRASSADE
jgi:hypothetical protein